MKCWRCQRELTAEDLPHLCRQCEKMMQTKYDPPPNNIVVNVKNNGKPKAILIDGEGNVSRLKINGGDEPAAC